MKQPYISGEFVHIYQPVGDFFPGPDSVELRAGSWYDHWVPNDHTLVKGRDDRWHLLGITHPATSHRAIHDGEWLLFHATSCSGMKLSDLKLHTFRDEKKVLPPALRPSEPYSIHSPFIVDRCGKYVMVYGPDPFRYAVSENLTEWKPMGHFFSADLGRREGEGDSWTTDPVMIEKRVSDGVVDRDPMMFEHLGVTYMVYCSKRNTVDITSTTDYILWSKPTTLLYCAEDHHPESPTLVFYEGYYYLFTCFWVNNPAGKLEPYSKRTMVYASSDLVHFAESAKLVAELPVHAPELVRDECGAWFITSAEHPFRGVSLARMAWK